MRVRAARRGRLLRPGRHASFARHGHRPTPPPAHDVRARAPRAPRGPPDRAAPRRAGVHTLRAPARRALAVDAAREPDPRHHARRSALRPRARRPHARRDGPACARVRGVPGALPAARQHAALGRRARDARHPRARPRGDGGGQPLRAARGAVHDVLGLAHQLRGAARPASVPRRRGLRGVRGAARRVPALQPRRDRDDARRARGRLRAAVRPARRVRGHDQRLDRRRSRDVALHGAVRAPSRRSCPSRRGSRCGRAPSRSCATRCCRRTARC